MRRASPAAAATNSIFTVAADGKRGYSGEDGPATLAPMHLPHGVAALPDGGFLFADTGTTESAGSGRTA